MYSYEERKKAIDLYIKYGKRASTVIRELGYPNRHVLIMWYKSYIENGKIEVPDLTGKSPYSDEEKQKAIAFYIEHGKNLKFTVEQLGYPSYHLLSKWINELAPSEKRIYKTNPEPNCNTPTDMKIKSVVELCTRTEASADEIASKYGVDRSTLYFWKSKFMPRKEFKLPDNCNTGNLEKDNEQLKAENERLKLENFQLQLMNDILTEAAKVIKKDQGISLETLTNREKMLVIDALRNRYQLKILLKVMNMAKSSYCYQENIY